MEATKLSRFVWTFPHFRSEGYVVPRECDACGVVFGFLPEIEICSQSIHVTHDIKTLGDDCLPATRDTIVVCYRCLPNYVEPLEASGYDLSGIAINGIPYVIHNTRELTVLREITGWNCFRSGSWVFAVFDPPKAKALLRISPAVVIEMTNFPKPRFRLKLEMKKEGRVFFSKLDIKEGTSYQGVMALAEETEATIRRKYNLVE